jgi:hypothetical protein
MSLKMNGPSLEAALCIWLLACSAFVGVLQPGDSLAVVTFERTYGGPGDDDGRSVCQTVDGGYIIAGSTTSFGGGDWDAYLIRTDYKGDTLWTRTYGGPYPEGASSVQQTSDGGYVLAGRTVLLGRSFDFYLVKTDSLGTPLWTRNYGRSGTFTGEECLSVQQTSDRGYIMAGYAENPSTGDCNFYIVKTDSMGDTLWTRTFGGATYDIAESVQETFDGGFIVAGWSSPHLADWEDPGVWLVKTTSGGDTVWTRKYWGVSNEGAHSVRQTHDGGYVVAGERWIHGIDYDIYLIKTDSLGGLLWARTYGGQAGDCGFCVRETSDRGYVVAGMIESFGTFGDVYLIKTDSLGDTLWTRVYGEPGLDCGYSVEQTSDGGYVVCGTLNAYSAGFADMYLVKTDADGLVRPWNPTTVKQDVIAELDSLKPQAKSIAKKINEAKKHVERSLAPELWLHETHLVCRNGKKVFDEEKHAVHEIERLCKEQKGFPCEVCERLNGMLVEADSILARVAIEDAKTARGDAEEIEKAEEEFSKALKESGKGHAGHAIDHFKHAWEHACRAVEKNQGDDDNDNSQLNSTTGTPLLFSLSQNNPNPFANETTISFTLPASAYTTLRVYDVTGREVARLVDGDMEPGIYTVKWNRDCCTSGIYFYRLESGDRSLTKKMTVIK